MTENSGHYGEEREDEHRHSGDVFMENLVEVKTSRYGQEQT